MGCLNQVLERNPTGIQTQKFCLMDMKFLNGMK